MSGSLAFKAIVYAADDSTPDVTFTDADFVEAPTGGGTRAVPLKGRSESLEWTLVVGDFSENVTSNLSDADGRVDWIGRLVEIQENRASAGFAKIGKGRISGVAEDQGPGRYHIRVSDERWVERRHEVFGKPSDFTNSMPDAATTMFSPAGLISDWHVFNATRKPEALVEKVDTNDVLIGLVASTPISEGMIEFMRDDLKDDAVPGASDGSTGNFRTLRCSVDGTTYEIIGFSFSKDYPILAHFELDEDNPNASLYLVWLAWDTSQPNVDDVLDDVYLFVDDGVPNETVPYHIGGEDGIDAVQLIKDMYDDVGVRYNSSAFSAWNESTNPNGLIGHPLTPRLHLRVTGPELLSEFAESVYRMMGAVPFIDSDGAVNPVLLHLPHDVDPDTLPTVGDGDVSDHPTFEVLGHKIVNVLIPRYETFRQRPARAVRDSRTGQPFDRDFPADLILREEKVLPAIEHDNLTEVGRHEHEVFYRGILGPTRDSAAFAVERLATVLAEELFDRFGDGAIMGSYPGLNSQESVDAGDYVVIEVSDYPDMATGARGGSRVVQVMEKQYGPAGSSFRYLDGGPDSQALAAPSASIAKSTGRPKHDVDVTISSLPADTRYQLQLKVGSEDWETYALGDANETVTVENLPSGTTIQCRARTTENGRIRSAWSSTTSATLDALTAPSAASASANGGVVTLTWTAGEADYDAMVTLDGADVLRLPLKAGSTYFEFTGLAASTLYTCGVKHVDPYGGESSLNADTATTGTLSELGTPRHLVVLQGAGDSYPAFPEDVEGTGIHVGLKKAEPHATTEIEVDTDSGFSTDPARYQIGKVRQFRIPLPVDDTTRYIRARHRQAGYTVSEWSPTVTAKPVPLAEDPVVNDGFAGGWVQVTFGADNSIIVSVGSQDPDVDEVHFTATDNTGFDEPDENDYVLSGQSLPVAHNTGTQVAAGDMAYVWAKFWNSVKGYGQQVKIQKIAPDITTGGPSIAPGTMDVENAGDLTVAWTWTPNGNVVDGTHDVVTRCREENEEDWDTDLDDTETSPASNTTQSTVKSSGGHDGERTYYGEIVLVIQATGEEIEILSFTEESHPA